LLQLLKWDLKVFGACPSDEDVPLGCHRTDRVRSSLDPIGHDRVLRGVKSLYSFDLDRGGPGSPNASAARIEESRQILHLGLTGGIVYPCCSGRRDGGHEYVVRRSDGRKFQQHVLALEPVCDRFDVAMLGRDLGAHALETFQMKVDRPGADRIATGQCDARSSETR
jgi:hypothetical protein